MGDLRGRLRRLERATDDGDAKPEVVLVLPDSGRGLPPGRYEDNLVIRAPDDPY